MVNRCDLCRVVTAIIKTDDLYGDLCLDCYSIVEEEVPPGERERSYE
jgi:hypothetical protein